MRGQNVSSADCFSGELFYIKDFSVLRFIDFLALHHWLLFISVLVPLFPFDSLHVNFGLFSLSQFAQNTSLHVLGNIFIADIEVILTQVCHFSHFIPINKVIESS